MHEKFRKVLKNAKELLTRPIDLEPLLVPRVDEIRHDIEALDRFLKIQTLRRAEEEEFRRLMEVGK